jgi:hypothetical protein
MGGPFEKVEETWNNDEEGFSGPVNLTIPI